MLRDEVFRNSPFDIKRLNENAYEEFSCLQCYSQGRIMFIGLHLDNNKIIEKEERLINERSFYKVCQFIEPGLINEIYFDNKMTIVNFHVKKNKKESFDFKRLSDFKREFIKIGWYSWNLGKFYNIENYISLMNKSLQQLLAEIKKNDMEEDSLVIKKNTLNRLAFHCLGFAEQAELLGNKKTSEDAIKITSSIVNIKEKDDLFKKRLGENGEMIISKDDLYRNRKYNYNM